jgi:hypothetical protein
MDRHSSWSGTPGAGGPGHGGGGRARRVPPRVRPRGRGAPRAAQWEGGRRWWLVALGTLALALILPRLAWGQGLRSNSASITLTVTAPAHLRAGTAAVRRSDSVVDASIQIPGAPFDVDRIEVRLEHAPAPGAALYVRASDGSLDPLGAEWGRVAPGNTMRVRALAPGGGTLPGGTWRVRFRLVPRDVALAALDMPGEIVIPPR